MTEDPDEATAAVAAAFPAIYLRFHRRDDKRSQLPAASRAVLQHLALTGPVTVGELCDHLDRAQSVVSDIVASLESKDLLERQSDPADRRRRLVWLSPAGHCFLEREREVLAVDLLRPAVAAMRPSDRAALVQGMQALLLADDVAGSVPNLPTHRSPTRKEAQ
jgi:DNA-binding MarR family transcriptional regulator